MSLMHAILGFLQDHPMTGYDLKTQCFDHTVAHFWPADQAQIYRTLDKLAEDGYLTSAVEVQELRPNRKVYQITDAGRAELARWLHTPQALAIYRIPFLIQLFFGTQLTNQEIIEQLKDQLKIHQDQLELYQNIPLPPANTPGLSRDLMLQRFTLDMGMQIEKATLDWLRQCIQTLRKAPDRDSDAE